MAVCGPGRKVECKVPTADRGCRGPRSGQRILLRRRRRLAGTHEERANPADNAADHAADHVVDDAIDKAVDSPVAVTHA